jgi:hypothetical protein
LLKAVRMQPRPEGLAMLGFWLFFGILGGGLALVVAARAFARGAAELELEEKHKLTWE